MAYYVTLAPSQCILSPLYSQHSLKRVYPAAFTSQKWFIRFLQSLRVIKWQCSLIVRKRSQVFLWINQGNKFKLFIDTREEDPSLYSWYNIENVCNVISEPRSFLKSFCFVKRKSPFSRSKGIGARSALETGAQIEFRSRLRWRNQLFSEMFCFDSSGYYENRF